MKSRNRSVVVLLAGLMFGLVLAVGVWAAESQYDTGTTSAEVAFGDSPAGYLVRSLYAKSDTAASTADFWTRKSKTTVGAAATNAATVIVLANSGATAITTNDYVIYEHASGKLHPSTVSAATTTNITLGTALTVAGAATDKVWGLQKSFVLPVGNGTLNPAGGYIYAVPGGSPLVVSVGTATAAVSVAVSVDR